MSRDPVSPAPAGPEPAGQPRGSVRSRTAWYLTAAVGNAALSFLALPITTRMLDPDDYGAFALVISFMAFGMSLSTLGMAFSVNQRWPAAELEERRRIISTLAGVGLLAGLAWAALALGAHAAFANRAGVAADVPRAAIALSALGMVVTPLWLLSVEILTLQGRAAMYAAGVLTEAGVRVAATLAALYPGRAGALSLFVGYAAGATAQSLLALKVLTPYLRLHPARQEWRAWRQAAKPFVKAQLSDTGYVLLERSALTAGHGLHELGLYTHSQRYREIAQIGVKSVSRGVWPVTLAEARDPDSSFPRTKATWDPIFLLLGLAGVAAAFLGDEVLRVLTNDKFTRAAPLIPLWLAVVIVQNTAKAHNGVLYSVMSARHAGWLNTSANIAGAVSLFPLLWLLGPAGALVAAAVHAVILRTALRLAARRYRALPFQDQWAVSAAAMCLTATALNWWLSPTFGQSLLLTAASCSVLAGAAWPMLKTAARQRRRRS